MYRLYFKLFSGEIIAALFGVVIAIIASLASISLMSLATYFLSSMAISYVTAIAFDVFTPSALIRLFAILRTSFRYFERIVTHNATFKIICNLRVKLFYEALKMEYVNFQKLNNTYVHKVLVNDLESLENFYIREVLPLLIFICSLSILSIYIAYFSIDLFVVFIFLMLLSSIVIPYFLSRFCFRVNYQREQLATKIYNLSFDIINRLFEYISYNIIDEKIANLKYEYKLISKIRSQIIFYEHVLSAIINFIALLTFYLFINTLIIYCENNILNTNTMIMLSVLSMASYELSINVAFAILNHRYIAFKIKRVLLMLNVISFEDNVISDDLTNKKVKINSEALLNYKGQERVNKRNIFIQKLKEDKRSINSIKLAHLTFSYDDVKVIDNLNFTFNNKQNYQIIAPIGSGKSSLFNLMIGIFKPTSGTINYCDKENSIIAFDKDTKDDYDSFYVKSNISYFMQDARFVPGSVKELFYRQNKSLTEDDIYDYLKIVELDSFFKNRQDGLNTWISPFEEKLSYGQLKRLYLALILSKKAQFYLLDECTEGIDEKMSLRIMERVKNKYKGIILVSHNFKDSSFITLELSRRP